MTSRRVRQRRALALGVGLVVVVVWFVSCTTLSQSPLATEPFPEAAREARWSAGVDPANAASLPLATLADPQWVADTAAKTGIPERALAAYAGAALRLSVTSPECGLTWNTLAGIGWVESHHGTIFDGYITEDGSMSEPVYGITLDGDNGTIALPDFDDGNFDLDPNADRAVGPMQIIPPTWAAWHVDANLDGVEDGQSIDDSSLVSAGYLCYNSETMTTRAGWNQSIRSYNDAPIYAIDVAAKADEYARATSCVIFC
jgi:membrane-bound lytic murein transglycosylase B